MIRTEAKAQPGAHIAQTKSNPSKGNASTPAPEKMKAWLAKAAPAMPSPAKTQITLRIDNDIIAAFRSTGKGWQSRMNEALRIMAGLSDP